MKFDLRIMVKAAARAIEKLSAPVQTIGLAAKDIPHWVDSAAHLAREHADPARIADLAHYYKNFVGQGAHAAQQATQAVQHVAPAVKKTPTIATSAGPALARAAETVGPKKVIEGAVSSGLPAAGTASVLEELMRSGGGALGIKSGSLADREYMRGAQEVGQGALEGAKKHMTAANALRFGLPGVYGAVGGAEAVPENRWLGAAAGAAGGIGGSELGGMAARSMGAGTLGDIIGRVIGASAGTDLAARGARLAVT